MSELKPELASLVRAGREAFRPQQADRDRVLQSLRLALGDGAVGDRPHGDGSNGAGTGQGVVGRFAVRSWVLGGLGAFAVGVGVVVGAQPWTKAHSQATSPAAASIPAADPAPPPAVLSLPNTHDPPEQPRVEGPSGAPHSLARPSDAPATADSLPEEVRLLSRAAQQLSAGHADDALRTLGEHERRFPTGALAEERVAARVQSLCALGRTGEAKVELARLARAYPQSAHLDRARRFCDRDTH